MASLGLPKKVGTYYSAIPPADGPECGDVVRAILEALRPEGVAYRPLWVTNIWGLPTGGHVRVIHHVFGYYDPHPENPKRPLRHLVLPTIPLYGIRWEHPIFEAELLDGLSDEERNRGVFPRYQPLDWRVLDGIRLQVWKRAQDRRLADERRMSEAYARAVEDADAEAKAKAYRSLDAEVTYRRNHDDLRLRCVDGAADRVFVSETLRQMPSEHPAA